MSKVGIIGGSGLYDLEGIEINEEMSLLTPFGQPSCNFLVGKLGDTEVVFLPRHGKGHRINPSEINYRANIFAMKRQGVDAILSVSACGSLKEELKPLDFVVPDQFVDRTKARPSTFFDEGIVAHVPLAEPTSAELRTILVESAKEAGSTVHDGGTYVNMEGPQFSTIAESNLYRSWGMDIIGMTNFTEARLAREAEISYATLAAVTDYDCWHDSHESVTVEMIIANLNQNVENARKILQLAIPKVGALTEFSAADALKYSIVTQPDLIPEQKKKQLDILIGKYMS
ncbi:MAG: S-methyl-5'-thioadenosine phosphorylase [Candidatus Omnitrophica bacterium]|nr:S-methyl-5'-thioadenosine phosphorylase [Candidatus Omnitrophota bacterium]